MAAPIIAPGARQAAQAAGALAANQNDKNVRISDGKAGGLIGTAFAFDALQAGSVILIGIPFFGIFFATVIPLILSICAFVTFGLWFMLLRINYFGGKQAAMKLLAIFAALVIDFMPFVMALPAITGGVVLMIIASRIEDTVGNRQQLSRRLRARQFWMGLAQNRVVQAVAGDSMERSLQKTYKRGSNRMAAQVAYGRKAVTAEERATGMDDLADQYEAIGREAPGAQNVPRPRAFDAVRREP